MPTENGYSNQKKKGQAQFKTINQVGSNQYGNPISQKTLFDKTASAIAITAVTDVIGADGQVEFWQITLPTHTAAKFDVMRMITGTLLAWEYDILRIIDANNFYILPISDTKPLVAETAKVLGWTTSKSTQEGELIVIVPAPVGAATEAKQDDQIVEAVDTNTKLDTLIAKDFATEVTLAHISLSYMQIGFPGLPINAGLVAGTDGTDMYPILTDTAGRLQVDAVVGLPTGAATEAKQDAELLLLNDIELNTNAVLAKFPSSIGQKVTAGSISMALSTEQEAMINDIESNLVVLTRAYHPIISPGLPDNAVLMGGSDGSNLYPIKVDSDGELQVDVLSSALPAGAATEAKQDTLIAKDFATETTLAAASAKLPATLGQKTMANSFAVTMASDQSALTVSSGTTAGTITSAQITVGTSAVRATVAGTAPNAARKKLMIKPSKNNTGAVYLGASGVTTANGLEIIGPDRLEFEFDSGDYYLISDTAAQVVEVVEKV